MAEYLDVLVLCSDPVNFRRTLNLAQELVQFEHVIRRSELAIRLRRVIPPTLDQLQQEFSRAAGLGWRPSVFHFLGHGDDDGLYFETEHGEAQLVKGHELKEALSHSPVQVVLLNACWSATKRAVSLCDFLTREQVADAAVGHETPVGDESAIEFARQFYSLVTHGKTVREAYQRAANSLAEQGKLGAAEVELVGNGEQVLTADLPSGSRSCVIESGLPKFGHLPEPPVFYGRGEELVQLSRSLADAGLTGFGLWGIGGIGKTALAKVAARRNAWRYEGAVWVDIRDTTQKTTAELLRLALCRLYPGAPDADPAFELSRRLRESPSLIVLDNLEDLPEAEHAALARFIQQVPKNGSRILLTARVPLEAVEESPDVATRRMTHGLDEWNGAHYVQHFARQKDCTDLIDALWEHGQQIEGLCVQVTKRLNGHPKMLELAVGIAQKGREVLVNALQQLPEDAQQRLAAMVATSLKYLGDDGNRVLPLLGFFPIGKLTPEALDVAGRSSTLRVEHATSTIFDSESQTNEAGGDEPDLRWLISGREQLVAAGLMEHDQARNVYTFHPVILDEARRHRPSGEVRYIVTLHLMSHFAEYVVSNHNNHERIDRCFETVMALMESLWSQRADDSDGLIDAFLAGMVVNLGSYFHDRGLWSLGQTWHDRINELQRLPSDSESHTGRALRLYQQGRLLAARGESEAARAVLNESLRLAEKAGTQHGISSAMHQLGIVGLDQGNLNEARQLFQRSIEIKDGISDSEGLASTLHQLAMLENDAGDLKQARNLLQQSIHIKEKISDKKGLAASLHELACIESSDGNFTEARRLLQESMQITEAIGNLYGSAGSLHELAVIEFNDQNLSEARRLLQRSITIKESVGDQRGIGRSLGLLAAIESTQGNLTEARLLLLRSIEIKEVVGDKIGLSGALCQLARLETKFRNYAEAQRLYDRSTKTYLALGDIEGAAAAKCNAAWLYAMDGDSDIALKIAREAVQDLEAVGSSEAESALKTLREIERFALDGKSQNGVSLSHRLDEMIAVWSKLSPEERADRLSSMVSSGTEPAEQVLLWLAHSCVCFANDEVADCTQAMAQAEQLASAIAREDVRAVVAESRQQLDRARSNPSSVPRLLAKANQHLLAGELDAALSDLEQAVIDVRLTKDPVALVVCLFNYGKTLLEVQRHDESVVALREALELATEVAEVELTKAVQQVLTVATRAAKGE